MTDWFTIPHLLGVRVTGEDALAFCQAQFTADFRQFDPNRWHVTAWCEPKGRCLAIILAATGEGNVDLVLPTSQADLLARLKMYAIGRKLNLSDAVPVVGSSAAAATDRLVGSEPERALRLLDEEDALAPPHARPDAVRAWRVADLCQPIPWLTPATSARFLPQFLGLEDSGGLSYTKGCFPGQEVIARLHYLGSIKYHLLGFELPVGMPAEPDVSDKLVTPSGDNAGEVLDCVRVDAHMIGLAVSPIGIEAGVPALDPRGSNGQPGQMTDIRGLCYHQQKLPN
ncbi:MAG: YgfZ/GcvT domain-containing protein [Wenzhouxiangella sp.]